MQTSHRYGHTHLLTHATASFTLHALLDLILFCLVPSIVLHLFACFEALFSINLFASLLSSFLPFSSSPLISIIFLSSFLLLMMLCGFRFLALFLCFSLLALSPPLPFLLTSSGGGWWMVGSGWWAVVVRWWVVGEVGGIEVDPRQLCIQAACQRQLLAQAVRSLACK